VVGEVLRENALDHGDCVVPTIVAADEDTAFQSLVTIGHKTLAT